MIDKPQTYGHILPLKRNCDQRIPVGHTKKASMYITVTATAKSHSSLEGVCLSTSLVDCIYCSNFELWNYFTPVTNVFLSPLY